MSSGKDHAPHPTIKSIAGDVIQNDFCAVDADAVTAGFYPDCGLYVRAFLFPCASKTQTSTQIAEFADPKRY